MPVRFLKISRGSIRVTGRGWADASDRGEEHGDECAFVEVQVLIRPGGAGEAGIECLC